MFGTNVNRIVVNQTVLDGPGKIDAPRAVILADVVAHNRSRVPGALFGAVAAFIADQQESAVVVVAIIVLDDRIPAVPVGIESFAVPLSFCSVSLVVLNHRIVGAPGPDRHIVSIRPLI